MSANRCTVAAVLLVATCQAYRVNLHDAIEGMEQSDNMQHLAYQQQQQNEPTLQADGPAATSCQYAGLPGKRPELHNLVSVCLNGDRSTVGVENTQTCIDHAKQHYSGRNGRVVLVAKDELSVADCEDLCTTNWNCPEGGQCAPIPGLAGRCRGYTVREPYMSVPSKEHSKPSCWLIPGNAASSRKYPDEVKLDHHTLHDYGSKTTKKTFLKQQCDCGTRFVHLRGSPDRTILAIKKAQLKNAEGQNVTLLQQEVDLLQARTKKASEISSLGGVYDWIPFLVPHRLDKGKAAWMPHTLTKMLGGENARMLESDKQFSKYWNGPIRITNMYKKLDLSSLLYKCLDKETKVEAWFLATKEMILKEANAILDKKEKGRIEVGEMPDFSQKENLGVIITLFFNLRCMGYQLDGKDGSLLFANTEFDNMGKQLHGKGEDTGVTANTDFLSNGKGDWSSANNVGCFKDSQKAAQMEETLIVNEVMQSDIGGDKLEGYVAPDKRKLLNNNICEQLLVGEDNSKLFGNFVKGQKLLEWQNALGGLWATGSAVTNLKKKMWNWGANTSKVVAPVRENSKKELLARTSVLMETAKNVIVRIKAIEATDDPRLKLFCAKEMLEAVQLAGGIWPKISQNLAMRPDIVKDDFARNKLKETQSGNKNQGTQITLDYIREVDPKVMIDGVGLTSITKFMEYDRFLSAGSVGQVDLWKLSTDTPESLKLSEKFKASLPVEAQGTKKFIVKTVFAVTEDLYIRDWTLLETICSSTMKSFLPPAVSTIWKVMANLETSIFDEFDLRKEAKFTTDGRAMLADFSAKQPKGSPKVTTPVGLATNSPYVMIQTLASGLPLSDHMEQVKGQWDRLAEWRVNIYSTILNVFGYTAIEKGFFQSDPHPGNWFWDSKANVLSLIDWGGVENWGLNKETKHSHCELAQFYKSMGAMSEVWEACDSVVISGSGLIDGTYKRAGVAIYKANEGEDELFMGHTYASTYKHSTKPLTLWYDGTHWEVSEVDLFDPQVTKQMARTLAAGTGGHKPEQSFFGLAFGRALTDIAPSEHLSMVWTAMKEDKPTGKPIALEVSSGRDASCNQQADRTQVYQMAAEHLGITLKSQCEKIMFLDTSSKELQRTLKTEKMALVCLRPPEDKNSVAKGMVGVPPKKYNIGQDESGKPIIEIGDLGWFPLIDQTLGVGTSLEASQDRVHRPAKNPLNELSADGVGRSIDWKYPLIAVAPEERMQVILFDQAQRAQALATSLFDSDVAEAAVMALQGRQSLSVFSPGEAPQAYTLFARCAIVFHGMMMDMLLENSLRLVPIPKLQWLLQPQGDRFFEAWQVFAKNYIDKNADTCNDPDGKWRAMRGGI